MLELTLSSYLLFIAGTYFLVAIWFQIIYGNKLYLHTFLAVSCIITMLLFVFLYHGYRDTYWIGIILNNSVWIVILLMRRYNEVNLSLNNHVEINLDGNRETTVSDDIIVEMITTSIRENNEIALTRSSI